MSEDVRVFISSGGTRTHWGRSSRSWGREAAFNCSIENWGLGGGGARETRDGETLEFCLGEFSGPWGRGGRVGGQEELC